MEANQSKDSETPKSTADIPPRMDQSNVTVSQTNLLEAGAASSDDKASLLSTATSTDVPLPLDSNDGQNGAKTKSEPPDCYDSTIPTTNPFAVLSPDNDEPSPGRTSFQAYHSKPLPHTTSNDKTSLNNLAKSPGANEQSYSNSSSDPGQTLSAESKEWLNKFNLRMACNMCYCRSGWQPHKDCRKDSLICQLHSQKRDENEVWGKIRRRPEKDIKGHYKLCRRSQSKGCCEQENCCFSHSEEETNVWNAEKQGHFDRKEICRDLRFQQNNGPCFQQNIGQNRQSLPLQNDPTDGFHTVTSQAARRKSRHQSGDNGPKSQVNNQSTRGHLPEGQQVQQNNASLKNHKSDRDTHRMLMSKVRGNLMYLCENCFDGAPPVIREKLEREPFCSGEPRHKWNKVLVHVTLEMDRQRYLKVRKYSGKLTRPQLCRHIRKPLGCLHADTCHFAHNEVEMEVWQCQAKDRITQQALVRLCAEGFIPNPPHLLCHLSAEDSSKSDLYAVASYSEHRREWNQVIGKPNIRSNTKLVLCSNGDECRKQECTHPHIPEEKDLWEYMAKYNLRTLDEVMAIATSADSRPTQNNSMPHSPPPRPKLQPYPCTFCSLHFPDSVQLQHHLQTARHRLRVDTYDGTDWKYREPPWNDVKFELCPLVDGGVCLFSGNDSCTKAHSQKELAEWTGRKQYRDSQSKKAKEQKLHASTSTYKNRAFVDNMEGITVTCSGDLNKFLPVESKAEMSGFTHSWKFTLKITNKKPLKLHVVSLLFSEPSENFFLPHGGEKLQVCPVDSVVHNGNWNAYQVDVCFQSKSLGFFEQCVVFDFGTGPVLVQKLKMDIGSGDAPIADIQDTIQAECWNITNSRIVKFTDATGQSNVTPAERNFNEKLLLLYTLPTRKNRNEDLSSIKLTRENYKDVMHRVLFTEERECNRKISGYATTSTLNVCQQVKLSDGYTHFASNGQLFASINLQQALLDDTVASHIVIQSVRMVLLKFDSSNTVYEAAILPNQSLGSASGDTVFVKLGKECVTEQKLSNENNRRVTIQLQLDRTQFCFKHFAIDQLRTMDIVFPQESRQQRLVHPSEKIGECNERQKQIIDFISHHGGRNAPSPLPGVGPVLLCGPFGTGKTFTLATAVMELVKKRPKCKILICTHSNSAADWYITSYLNNFVSQNPPKRSLIRVYATYRNLGTIPLDVRPYVPKDENGKIRIPDQKMIKESQIVVTTLTAAINLISDEMRGCFSHILIDEAGQVLEAEALIPLAMATKETCVVLAGDHMQMSPKIFSEKVRDAGFNKSLLERLFHSEVCNVFLTANYRTCQPLLDFIAKTYYCNIQLQAKNVQPIHSNFYPLTFYNVMDGIDECVGQSYVNIYEVHEVVKRVKELRDEWPEEWGLFHENICVISPCTMQVRQIRDSLRKEWLSNVTVETVDNVQGKQYRAVIISTVRTRRTIQFPNPEKESKDFYCGFLSDPKLLNTVFTRTKSLLVVVGDAATLCSVGPCSTKWQNYLRVCETNRSLYPRGTTLDIVHAKVRLARQGLNPHATPFQPASQSTAKAASTSLSTDRMQDENAASYEQDDEDSLSETDSWCTDDEDSDIDDILLRELRRQVEEDTHEYQEMQAKKSGLAADEQQESIAKVHMETADDQLDSVAKVHAPRSACDQPESIAKVHMQTADDQLDSIAKVHAPRSAGDQPESIAKVHKQKADDQLDSVAKVHAPRSAGDQPESIAKVYMQTADDQLDSIAKVRAPRSAGDQPESIAKVHMQTADDQLESVAKVHVTRVAGINSDSIEIVATTAVQKSRSAVTLRQQNRQQMSKALQLATCTPEVSDGEKLPDILMKPGDKSSKTHKEDIKNIVMVPIGNKCGLVFKDTYDRSNLKGADDAVHVDGGFETEAENLKMMSDELRLEGLQQVQTDPEMFKRGLFVFETSGFTYVIPRGINSSQPVWICGKRARGPALDGDEVVIEILPNDGPEDEDAKKYGKVKCILERSTNPRNRDIVCTLDQYTDNLMVPVSHKFPKIIAYRDRKQCKTKDPDLVPVSLYKQKNRSSKFNFKRVVMVNRKERQDKLFIVKYRKWAEGSPYPMCRVVKELPACDEKNGLDIIKYIHDVKDKFKPSTMKYVKEKFPSTWKIHEKEVQSRKDLRDTFNFTVDHPETDDLDDALSIEVKDGQYHIGIHIADVSSFVPQGSPLDEEAKERALTFYTRAAFSKPVRMLPTCLSTDLCSLSPGQDRLAVSVFVTMAEDGSIIKPVDIQRSVIRSNKKLTYEEAEKMITASKCGLKETVEEKVSQLSQLAQKRRRERLQDGYFAFSHEQEQRELNHPYASSMVEEMMLVANEEVAKFLESKYPTVTPVRCQLPPDEDSLNEWLGKHKQDIANSLSLQAAPALEGMVTQEAGAPNDVYVPKETVKNMLDVCDSLDETPSAKLAKLTDLICSDDNHPQLAVAYAMFNQLQERAIYINAGDQEDPLKRRHHSLKKASYTSFTSPIRRYVDIVVHRLVIAALAKVGAPYTSEEISSICHHSTNQGISAKRYENDTSRFQLALKLKEAPYNFPVFVSAVDESSLQVIYPYRRFMSRATQRIPMQFLNPIKKPDLGDGKVGLMWKPRIYDVNSQPTCTEHIKTVLNTKQSVTKICANIWQKLLNNIKQNDPSKVPSIKKILTKVSKHAAQLEDDKRHQSTSAKTEISSEALDIKGNHIVFAECSRDFQQGDVLHVVLSATLNKGILTPSVQQFKLTHKVGICMEHWAAPAQSFDKVACKHAVRCSSVERYKETWLPIIEMMSVHNAVRSNASCCIQGIQIEWIPNLESANVYSGFFHLSKSFCEERHIKFTHSQVSKDANESDDEESPDPNANLDYLCIRYLDLPVSEETKAALQKHDSKRRNAQTETNNIPESMSVTVHASVTEITDYKDTLTVRFVACQPSPLLPKILVDSCEKFPSTVEVIQKLEQDRRLENAVWDLDKATPLIQEICLQRKNQFATQEPGNEGTVAFSMINQSPFGQLNDSQQRALDAALQQEFTPIQGPPGTGKTILGAVIACNFAARNKALRYTGPVPPQVLYCGPSNESVNVVASCLRQYGDLKVVRMYSETIQCEEFPIPGDLEPCIKTKAEQENKMDPRLSGIALHHLIRKPSNTHSEKIRAFDKTFRMPGYKASWKEIKDYKWKIKKAEEEELRKYQIILCTCNAAGSRRINKDSTNVMQCIIDEAGMCSEPESLVPLTATSPTCPRQIVLIGDHKQLRPVITESTCKDLGMDVSLLEQYEKSALMLTEQYRMHESICHFPSGAFYKGSLETSEIVKKRPSDKDLPWPGGADFRNVFCHVNGKEETLPVKAAEGNENSKANVEEVKEVIRILRRMVSQHNIEPHQILVLSQYRLQCAKLREEIVKYKELKQITVSTVITSQGGERDYVILSTVRSLPLNEIPRKDDKPTTGWKKRNLGFITDENQMNVAITRAKHGLIIVGNQRLLQVHDQWRNLLNHYRLHSAVVNANNFLRNGPHFQRQKGPR